MRRFALLILLGSAACESDGGLAVASSAPIFQPATLNFGPSDLSQTHRREVVLTSDAERALSVLEVEFVDGAIGAYVARLSEGGTLKGAVLPRNQSLGLTIIFQPAEPIEYAGTMRVLTEDRVFELPLFGTGRDVLNQDLELMPSQLDFGTVAIGTKSSKVFSIKNKLREAQVIDEIRSLASRRAVQAQQSVFWMTEVSEPETLMEHRIGSRAQIELMAHFRPRSVGDFSDTLQLMMTSGGYVPFEVKGQGEAGGRLACTPKGLDFGGVRRGSAADLYTTCTVESGVYRVESVMIEQGSSDNFSLVAAPEIGRTYLANESFDLTVRFSGRGLASSQAGRVSIQSVHGETTSIELTGEVTPTPKPETALTVHLEWDTTMTDFDLHLVRSPGLPFESLNDCYFMEKNPDWGQLTWSLDDPFLDQDDLESGGPEEINLAAPAETQYDIYVHYYGAPVTKPTLATIRIEFFGVTAHTDTRLFNRCGELWKVAEVTDLGALASVNVVNEITFNAASGMCP